MSLKVFMFKNEIPTGTFYGRTANYGSLRKDYLSSGTKTLLNIISHPDKCFDVCECGGNVLSFYQS